MVDVSLDLEHRQKGLLWYSTYKVAFAGTYSFRNPSDKERTVNFVLNFLTIGSVATLFVAMQVTGRIRWADKFSLKPSPEPTAELT